MKFRELLRGTYEINLNCSNCDYKSLIRIPKGTKIEDWISQYKAKCKNCGCAILEDKEVGR